MKTQIRIFLIIFLVLASQVTGLKAQGYLYRDTFIQSVTYCPTGTYAYKWTKYKNFRANLDTTLNYFNQVRMWGEVAQNNSVSSRTCTDRTVINGLANALKSGTAYVGTCNGFKWEVSAAGTCNNGGCSAPTSEVVHFASYPSSLSSGVCACAAQDYWVIRTTIQNNNKGGVMVGTTGTTCNPATQWIELEFKAKPPIGLDVQTLGISSPDKCIYNQDIKARFKNAGKNQFDSFQYYLKINTTTTGPFKAKVRLAPGKDTLWTVSAGYSYTANTNYTISVWAKNPNNKLDSFAANDTSTSAFRFSGNKPTPDGKDTTVCGSQSLVLRAIPVNSSDSIIWFSDRALTKNLGRGNTYKTPYLSSGATYKYYVSTYSDFERAMLSTGLNPPAYGWPSSMFNIRTTGGDITVDSLGLNIYDFNFSVGTQLDVEVWLRKGSWSDAGATTTSSMWTKIYTGPVISRGSAKRSTLKASFDMKGGQQYAVYVNPTVTASNTILAKLGSFTYQNTDIVVSGGTLNQINFGNALTGYTIETEVFYKKYLCISAPDSITLKINPAPFGAKLTSGTPFQTSPKKSGTGNLGSPHVVALGDTLAYNLMEPTGYKNSDHNTTWKVKNVTIKSKTGRILNTFTWSDPVSSSGAAGRLVYTPDKIDIDSQYTAEVSIQDLGLYNCDTLLKHYIYVAPLPEPDFTRSKVTCEGDAVEFVNKSKILTGFLDHKWYFGDGDSSEAVDPIHFYPKGGVYYVKYKAISSIYG
ncbi:MAG: hypothetical protein FJ347_09915, partial [Sphingomonadales bacterium]|nr:hypothetical protein [Sphingomonadales bacterium]